MNLKDVTAGQRVVEGWYLPEPHTGTILRKLSATHPDNPHGRSRAEVRCDDGTIRLVSAKLLWAYEAWRHSMTVASAQDRERDRILSQIIDAVGPGVRMPESHGNAIRLTFDVRATQSLADRFDVTLIGDDRDRADRLPMPPATPRTVEDNRHVSACCSAREKVVRRVSLRLRRRLGYGKCGWWAMPYRTDPAYRKTVMAIQFTLAEADAFIDALHGITRTDDPTADLSALLDA